MIKPFLEDPMGVLALILMGGGVAILLLYGMALVGLNIWAAVSLARETRRQR